MRPLAVRLVLIGFFMLAACEDSSGSLSTNDIKRSETQTPSESDSGPTLEGVASQNCRDGEFEVTEVDYETAAGSTIADALAHYTRTLEPEFDPGDFMPAGGSDDIMIARSEAVVLVGRLEEFEGGLVVSRAVRCQPK